MASAIELYHQWRRRICLVSKEELAWRHDLINARLDTLVGRFDAIDRRLDEVEPKSVSRRRALASVNGQRLNYYSEDSPDNKGFWQLDEEGCPCDIHFREYLASNNVRGKSIFHFGTGGHHTVGLGELGRDNPNHIFSVTASPEEHDEYIELIVKNPALAIVYKVVFADIYTFHESNLPQFDTVTLFHLGEYWDPIKSSYAPLDDRKLLDLMIAKLRPDGQIVGYSSSRTWDAARTLFEGAVESKTLMASQSFKTLRFYTKGEARG